MTISLVLFARKYFYRLPGLQSFMILRIYPSTMRGPWIVQETADEVPPFDEVGHLGLQKISDYELTMWERTDFAKTEELILLHKVYIVKTSQKDELYYFQIVTYRTSFDNIS